MAKIPFSCAGCGTQVFKYLSQLTRVDVVFCTLQCRNKNYKKAVPDWHPANYKEYKHVCIACGNQFIKTGRCFKPNKRLYCSKSCKAKHAKRKPMSAETKIKLSIAASKQNKNYIAKHVYLGPKGKITMKSSWEVKYANWLDQQGISWVYEPEFKLSNGYIYLPDFQLSNSDIIEIKGYMREDAQRKWDMFCADYPNLNKKLLRKEDLKKIGII
ncbi:MAG: hypothetical protein QXG63_06035 [Nitrososphaerales archaeon]